MMKNNSALDRLKSTMNISEEDYTESSISTDDYINEIEDDIISKMDSSLEDFISNNSTDSKTKSTITEVSIDNTEIKEKPKRKKINSKSEDILIDVTDTGDDAPMDQNVTNEVLFNNNTEITQNKTEVKPRTRKKRREDTSNITKVITEKIEVDNESKNPLYDQLVILLVEELKSKHFKFNGFNDESMNILYNYMQTKF